MKDRYDLAIDYLVEHPEEISNAWYDCYDHRGGIVFRFATPVENVKKSPFKCGCLTMIRESPNWSAFNGDHTKNDLVTDCIRNDADLVQRHILLALRGEPLRTALNRYAEWQRALEVELA